MRENRDPQLGATLDHASPQRVVVERADRDLDRGHGHQVECLVELPACHVREPHPACETPFAEPRQRADRGAPGRPRIRGVEEVQVDRETVEGIEARLAVRTNRPGPAVRDPTAADPRHPALRHDARRRRGAHPPQAVREEPLVVAELVVAEAVGPRGVEDGDSRLHGRGDRREPARLVPLCIRRQPHAAEADAELGRSKPWRAQATERTRGSAGHGGAAGALERLVLRWRCAHDEAPEGVAERWYASSR